MLINTDNRVIPVRDQKFTVTGGGLKVGQKTVFGINCERWREDGTMAHCMSELLYPTVYFREDGTSRRTAFKMQPFGRNVLEGMGLDM